MLCTVLHRPYTCAVFPAAPSPDIIKLEPLPHTWLQFRLALKPPHRNKGLVPTSDQDSLLNFKL